MPSYVRKSLFVAMPLCAALVLAIVTVANPQPASAGAISSFDGPGAGTGAGQGTFPVAINRWGAIGLIVLDTSNNQSAFVREANGAFVAITPPNSVHTYLAGINSRGQAAGSFLDANHQQHGYFVNASGHYAQLDPPSATGFTTVVGVNDAGQVAGHFYNSTITRGFIWDSQHKKYLEFDAAPGAATFASAIDASGQVAGIYYDSTGAQHGFIRGVNGAVISFDIAGSQSFTVTAINAVGQITGNATDGEGTSWGFLRNSDGTVTTWGSEFHGGPEPLDINESGVIVGFYFADGAGNAAFERDQYGNISYFNIPFSNISNAATAVNKDGHVTGTYTDLSNVTHGWLE